MVQSIFVVKLHNILVLSFHHIVFHFQIVYCVKNLVFYLVNSNIRSEFLLRQEASHYYNGPEVNWPSCGSKFSGISRPGGSLISDKIIKATNTLMEPTTNSRLVSTAIDNGSKSTELPTLISSQNTLSKLMAKRYQQNFDPLLAWSKKWIKIF